MKVAWLKKEGVPAKYKLMSWPEREQLLAAVALKMRDECFYSQRSRVDDITRGLPRLIEEAGL